MITFRDGMLNYHSAILVLKKFGYKVEIEPPTYDPGEEVDEGDYGFCVAKKEGRKFIAGDPLALLGVAMIWESRGDWDPKEDDEDLWEQLLAETYGED